eukprot:1199115-Rhodomonas_salina.2
MRQGLSWKRGGAGRAGPGKAAMTEGPRCMVLWPCVWSRARSRYREHARLKVTDSQIPMMMMLNLNFALAALARTVPRGTQ